MRLWICALLGLVLAGCTSPLRIVRAEGTNHCPATGSLELKGCEACGGNCNQLATTQAGLANGVEAGIGLGAGRREGANLIIGLQFFENPGCSIQLPLAGLKSSQKPQITPSVGP